MNSRELIDKFVEASIRSGLAEREGDAVVVNECYRIKKDIRKELSRNLTEYAEVFYPLLEHDDIHVRLDAACALLPISQDDALKTLEKLTSQRGLISITAKMTIREWKSGRMKREI